jgi:hypothetical protein
LPAWKSTCDESTVTVMKVYLNDTPENIVIKVIKIIVDTYSIKV